MDQSLDKGKETWSTHFNWMESLFFPLSTMNGHSVRATSLGVMLVPHIV